MLNLSVLRLYVHVRSSWRAGSILFMSAVPFAEDESTFSEPACFRVEHDV